MGETKDIVNAIRELQNSITTLNEVVDWLQANFSNKSEPTEETTPNLTLEEVRAALADKSRAGFTDEVRGLLKKYGADRLSDIDPIHYRAVLNEAEGL